MAREISKKKVPARQITGTFQSDLQKHLALQVQARYRAFDMLYYTTDNNNSSTMLIEGGNG